VKNLFSGDFSQMLVSWALVSLNCDLNTANLDIPRMWTCTAFVLTFPFLFLDGKIFQEKVESLMYLRNSSSGGKSTDGSAFIVTTPTGFAALPLEGKTMNT